jgi:uncharacterized protein
MSHRAIRFLGAALALLAAALLSRPALGASWMGSAADQQQSVALPEPDGWVNDQAGALDQPNRDRLFALCVELESKTTAELAVVTIRSLHGEPIEAYAKLLFNEWGLGKRDRNNGVMLLFSIRDRRMRIQVGDGLTSVLPDRVCQRIIDDTIVPFFKAGRYGDGAYAGAARIAQILSAHYGQPLTTLQTHRPPRPPPRRRPSAGTGSGGLGIVATIGGILIVLFIIGRVILPIRTYWRADEGTPWWRSLWTAACAAGADSGGGGWSSSWGGGGGGGFGGGFSSGGGASGSW